MEIWKDIKGYEGLYQVSNLGNVKSLNYNHTNKAKNLTPKKNKKYLYVCLYKNNKQYYPTIHRLVAENFIVNPKKLVQVNHIDGNKQNNKVDNLEWCTNLENIQHADKNGLSNRRGKIRKVIQLDNDGNRLNEFEAIADALRALGKNVRTTEITKCCKGKRKTAFNYKWKYA